ncbi:O-antigen ligase family protein [Variovorax terrae]|uniref:O-antigen ligase family protein n=1 Tax=Variovorax terrae TaxID=2923278 RepID=A0A9X1VSX7_9BURK|nr:O-antigen ligase family protein [Variovorax terrae]MCJ0763306.1 O-antigen ligase family protein [Variovorax terrae]
MAKKKRSPSSKPFDTTQAPSPAPAAAPAAQGVKARIAAATRSTLALPAEIGKGDWTAILLALMMFFAPAMGVPHEEMLQDTLKSIIVSLIALVAGLLLFWHQRNRRDALRWHALMWLPLALMAYALGSMVWSHTYLGGVEAIRWFIFSLLLWLGLNTLSRERVPVLAWGIHWGAVVASLWTALQFWIDFRFFPQGPNPASTFVNRNFVAEFVICTIPFSVLLLARSRDSAQLCLLAFTIGFNIVAIMMTGTRSALSAMLVFVFVLPVILYLYRSQLAFPRWDAAKRILVFGVLLATVLGLGMIKTGNAKIIDENTTEHRGLTALERGFSRILSVGQKEEYTVGSFSVRMVMWKATARIIKAHPLSGVGAGAWEVDIPLYQAEGSQLETDYYVHNEILQLLAEYGLVGWLFLLCLLAYLANAAWRTWRNRTPEGQAEAPLRALALLSLLAFLIVSNAGFPWRMASTGAIFALALAVLAASDARLGWRGPFAAGRLDWRPAYSQAMAVAMMLCLALGAYISQQAAECESKIVRAVKLALSVSQSGDPGNPKWDKTRAEMLKLIKEGTDINPHYRKITPMVADELAKWGDWKNAVWIWESVVGSRPYVVAILSNIARGYAQLGQNDKALDYLHRAQKLQPNAPAVGSLEVILLSRTGKEPEALQKVKSHYANNVYDFDMVNAGYVLGVRAKDWPLAVRSMEMRNKDWPAQAPDGWIKIGNIYASTEIKDDAKALEAYKAALAAAADKDKASVRQQIPAAYQPRL